MQRDNSIVCNDELVDFAACSVHIFVDAAGPTYPIHLHEDNSHSNKTMFRIPGCFVGFIGIAELENALSFTE